MTGLAPEEIKSFKQVEGLLATQHDELTAFIKRADEEMEATKSVSAETKGKIEELAEKCVKLGDQLADFEKRMAEGAEDARKEDSLGELFTKSDAYKSLQDGNQGSARVRFDDIDLKTAITNATGQNQPLVPADRRPGIVAAPDRMMTIRDLLPTGVTTSNLIEFAKENVFTNNAGPQVGGSPEAFENVTKPESGITFTLATAAVTTLAHWIPASKQVLEDSPMLQSYINSRLMYGLKLKEETQLLNGTGANGELNGIYTQATAYSVQSPNLSNEIDIIRDAIRQAHASEYRPSAIILNPNDWYDIDVRKVGASDDRYVVGNPRAMAEPILWGLPVVVTNSMTAGTFLVGAFSYGAQIWDRRQATVEVSRENSDNFVKNMCTILAEERIALTVYRPGAFIKGSL